MDAPSILRSRFVTSARAALRWTLPGWRWTRTSRLVLSALGCALIGLSVLAIDLETSRWMRDRPLGEGAAKLFSLCEAFSHGAGAAMILIAVAVLDRSSRRKLPRAGAIALSAGLLANLVKLLVARWRPRAFDGDGTVWDTFHGWLPFLGNNDGVRWGSQLQSFPSAHAATGFGLAIALSWLYPQGRLLFYFLATLAALERVDAGFHYLSEVWFGAALGCLSGAIFFGDHPLPRLMTWWEKKAAVAAGEQSSL